MKSNSQGASALVFENTHLDIVIHNGQTWLIDSQIASALGYTDNVMMRGIYAPIAEKFTDEMTAKVKLSSEIQAVSGIKKARIFSLPGALLLAGSIHSEQAGKFCCWLECILNSETPTANSQGADAPGKSISLIEAIDTLCQASDITKFLQGAVSDSIHGECCEWSSSQAMGFAALLQDLVGRIEKASDIVDVFMSGDAS